MFQAHFGRGIFKNFILETSYFNVLKNQSSKSPKGLEIFLFFQKNNNLTISDDLFGALFQN